MTTERPDCQSLSYSTASTSGQALVQFSPEDANKYICFRAKNSLGVYGYKPYKITSNAKYQLVQDGDDLKLTESKTFPRSTTLSLFLIVAQAQQLAGDQSVSNLTPSMISQKTR